MLLRNFLDKERLNGVYYVIVNGHIVVEYGKIKKDILP